jgi:hypothetical protein
MKPAMYAFVKRLRNNQHTRRFSIAATSAGWEVREEHDSKLVRRTALSDWHRVEQARRLINRESATLKDEGWLEVID